MIDTELNFITDEERIAVRDRVIQLRDKWNTYSVKPSMHSIQKFSTLGDALYLLESERLPVEQINRRTQQILIDNFNWLYQRICSKVADITGKNTQLHPNLTAPGFHIGHIAGSYHVPFYHNDMSILTYDKEGSLDHSYSILIPIEVPSHGAHLEYLDADDTVNKLTYQPGAWHQWKATVKHKVGDLLLLENEYRITLQCHYYLNVNADTNYIFF